MSLDKKVKKEIKKGLIYGALASPILVVPLKAFGDMVFKDLLSYSDVIVKGENFLVNQYNIYSEAIQRLYENPVHAFSLLVSIPIIYTGIKASGAYSQLKSEERKRQLAKEERISAERQERIRRFDERV